MEKITNMCALFFSSSRLSVQFCESHQNWRDYSLKAAFEVSVVLNVHNFYSLSSASHSRDRIVVSTSRCGRDNPGSNPGHGKQLCNVAVTALWANFLKHRGICQLV